MPITDKTGTRHRSTSDLSRRRFLTISAAAAGFSMTSAYAGVLPEMPAATWRGSALGSLAEVKIHHPEKAEAERLVTLAISELHRLEQLFSLYHEQSDLLTLNRNGALEAPKKEFVELLQHSHSWSRISQGMFDPSIQPLWNLYADHFSRPDTSPSGPDAVAIRDALRRVGMDHVLFDNNRVVFRKKGMGLSFNGIAQGYITDKVVELLRAQGIRHSLVNMGETRTIGSRPDGKPWQAAIADPAGKGGTRPVIALDDRAMATSGGYGFSFDVESRFNHIFNPGTGLSPHLHQSVSIVHETATAADAMATAACLMPEDAIWKMLIDAGGGEAHIMSYDGKLTSLRT